MQGQDREDSLIWPQKTAISWQPKTFVGTGIFSSGFSGMAAASSAAVGRTRGMSLIESGCGLRAVTTMVAKTAHTPLALTFI